MRFLIVNTDDKTVVEEHDYMHRAESACATLNDHEIANDRVPCYLVQPTCPSCGSDDVERTDPIHNHWCCSDCSFAMTIGSKHK